MSFLKLFLEGTTAGDIAGVGMPLGKGDCPCKKDPESEECKSKKAKKMLRKGKSNGEV
jgi:hypothetical protein